MTRHRTRCQMLLVTLLLVAGACGGDPSAPAGDTAAEEDTYIPDFPNLDALADAPPQGDIAIPDDTRDAAIEPDADATAGEVSEDSTVGDTALPEGSLCAPCVASAECSDEDPADLCFVHGEAGSFCGRACLGPGDCPEGYVCTGGHSIEGLVTSQCVPTAGECSCSTEAIALGLFTPCTINGAWGQCAGERICTGEGLADCDAPLAEEEICNGADDDCDGEIDEGPAGGLCDDGIACTTDSCDDGQCVNTLVPGCCVSSANCDTGDPCLLGACIAGQCQTIILEGCCKTHGDCEDGLYCTTDLCIGNACQNHTVSDCCVVDADCDDGNPCTADDCDGNNCDHVAIEDCCDSDADCDDGDPCVLDTCTDGQCFYATIPNCCTSDGQCLDGDGCTVDTCDDGSCDHAPVAGCSIVDADCEDGDPCTLDDCVNKQCLHLATPDCCQSDADCPDDGDPCTAETCVNGDCVSGAAGDCLGLSPNADVWLEGSSNMNGYGFLIVGKTHTYPKKRSLIAFDLGAVPAGMQIASAILRVYFYAATKPSFVTEPGIDRVVEVHRVLIPWDEDEATKTVAQAGESWGTPWLGLDDTDAQSAPLTSTLWEIDDYGWKSFDVTSAAAAWYATPNQNHGLLLRATNEDDTGRDMRFYSREHGDAGLRPQLVVVYEPIP